MSALVEACACAAPDAHSGHAILPVAVWTAVRVRRFAAWGAHRAFAPFPLETLSEPASAYAELRSGAEVAYGMLSTPVSHVQGHFEALIRVDRLCEVVAAASTLPASAWAAAYAMRALRERAGASPLWAEVARRARAAAGGRSRWFSAADLSSAVASLTRGFYVANETDARMSFEVGGGGALPRGASVQKWVYFHRNHTMHRNTSSVREKQRYLTMEPSLMAWVRVTLVANDDGKRGWALVMRPSTAGVGADAANMSCDMIMIRNVSNLKQNRESACARLLDTSTPSVRAVQDNDVMAITDHQFGGQVRVGWG